MNIHDNAKIFYPLIQNEYGYLAYTHFMFQIFDMQPFSVLITFDYLLNAPMR